MSKALPLEALRGQHVMVFSAIGNPSSFEQTMTGEGLNIVEAIRYPDHHDYGMVEMQYIMDKAISRGVKALITTGKDAVKILRSLSTSIGMYLCTSWIWKFKLPAVRKLL